MHAHAIICVTKHTYTSSCFSSPIFVVSCVFVANPEILLYAVASPAGGLPNREKKNKKRESGSAALPRPATRSKKKKKKT